MATAEADNVQEIARQKVAALNLTQEQILQYQKKFNAFDLNRDGVISLREFAAVSKVFGYHLTRDEILDLFGKRDVDESGEITFNEFIIAMRSRSAGNRQVNLGHFKEVFKLYDMKKRGYVTADEAYPILHKELGFDQVKTEKLVDLYDKNRDYRLSFFEFVEFHRRVEQLKQQIVEAFNEFDQNHDGYVDMAEAVEIMVSKGVAADKVEALFRKADTNNDGRLDCTEFAVFWDVAVTP